MLTWLLSFSTLKMSFHRLLDVMLGLEFSLPCYIVLLCKICLFYFSRYFFFSLWLVFRNLTMMWLCMMCFLFSPLRFPLSCWTCLIFSIIFENILTFISSNIFLPRCVSPHFPVLQLVIFSWFIKWQYSPNLHFIINEFEFIDSFN